MKKLLGDCVMHDQIQIESYRVYTHWECPDHTVYVKPFKCSGKICETFKVYNAM